MERLLLGNRAIRDYLQGFSQHKWPLVVQLTTRHGIQSLKSRFDLAQLSTEQLHTLVSLGDIREMESFLVRERPDAVIRKGDYSTIEEEEPGGGLPMKQLERTGRDARDQYHQQQQQQQTPAQAQNRSEMATRTAPVDETTTRTCAPSPARARPSARWRLPDDNTPDMGGVLSMSTNPLCDIDDPYGVYPTWWPHREMMPSEDRRERTAPPRVAATHPAGLPSGSLSMSSTTPLRRSGPPAVSPIPSGRARGVAWQVPFRGGATTAEPRVHCHCGIGHKSSTFGLPYDVSKVKSVIRDDVIRSRRRHYRNLERLHEEEDQFIAEQQQPGHRSAHDQDRRRSYDSDESEGQRSPSERGDDDDDYDVQRRAPEPEFDVDDEAATVEAADGNEELVIADDDDFPDVEWESAELSERSTSRKPASAAQPRQNAAAMGDVGDPATGAAAAYAGTTCESVTGVPAGFPFTQQHIHYHCPVASRVDWNIQTTRVESSVSSSSRSSASASRPPPVDIGEDLRGGLDQLRGNAQEMLRRLQEAEQERARLQEELMAMS
eukprot:m51a1_g3469 hypothetical protein (549) ;mRNA; f:741510-743876